MVEKLIEKCKNSGIFINDRRDYLIGIEDYLNNNQIRTWSELLLNYSSSLILPKDDSDYGRFLSLACKLSQGWKGYLTDNNLFNHDLVKKIVKDLFGEDIDFPNYFDWCFELTFQKAEQIYQEYWNRLDKSSKITLLKNYLNVLTESIIDVFSFCLNRDDFESTLRRLDPSIQDDLIRFDLI